MLDVVGFCWAAYCFFFVIVMAQRPVPPNRKDSEDMLQGRKEECRQDGGCRKAQEQHSDNMHDCAIDRVIATVLSSDCAAKRDIFVLSEWKKPC